MAWHRRVVSGAQLGPFGRRVNISGDILVFLSKHHGKSEVKVPVNVAVEEPGARVARVKADSDDIALATHIHGVSANRVLVIVSATASAADNGERMTVQVHGV